MQGFDRLKFQSQLSSCGVRHYSLRYWVMSTRRGSSWGSLPFPYAHSKFRKLPILLPHEVEVNTAMAKKNLEIFCENALYLPNLFAPFSHQYQNAEDRINPPMFGILQSLLRGCVRFRWKSVRRLLLRIIIACFQVLFEYESFEW